MITVAAISLPLYGAESGKIRFCAQNWTPGGKIAVTAREVPACEESPLRLERAGTSGLDAVSTTTFELNALMGRAPRTFAAAEV